MTQFQTEDNCTVRSPFLIKHANSYQENKKKNRIQGQFFPNFNWVVQKEW